MRRYLKNYWNTYLGTSDAWEFLISATIFMFIPLAFELPKWTLLIRVPMTFISVPFIRKILIKFHWQKS
ncbi:hypothetical protein FC83_GL002193 [Agrilactobacillus composti DSM 18527 = JCM 14202]|uniref:Uncharacterized protein n=1 Tax=Agrilactobacillus composti DSM 18527 = JCM 14202 TaxID=1423734 RepID=A0A0R1Y442_9LACO|nr:hypothetical protein FC83_GL002193 [Agrilactobacillus composti DSM 18527 = JCM 14202]